MAKYSDWVTEQGIIVIEGWTRDGLSEKQIAENVGVAYSTFRDWKKKFPALSAALKKGKDFSDRQVENALYKKAIGYDYVEETYKIVSIKEKRVEERNGKKIAVDVPVDKEVLVKKTTKHVAPDTGAAAFWLKNRKPAVWRDKQEVEHSGSMNITNPYEGLTEDELRKLAARDG